MNPDKWSYHLPSVDRARLVAAGFSRDEAVEAVRVWVDKWRHGPSRISEYLERCIWHATRLRREGKRADPGQVGAEIRRRMKLK